jgi:uncharacterized protein with ACT and thioredoxin-like domain
MDGELEYNTLEERIKRLSEINTILSEPNLQITTSQKLVEEAAKLHKLIMKELDEVQNHLKELEVELDM